LLTGNTGGTGANGNVNYDLHARPPAFFAGADLAPIELWSFTVRVLPRDIPGPVRVRRLLKYALRGLGLKCVRLAESDEVVRLRKIIDRLAVRVAAHCELLSRRAEKAP